MPEDTRKLVTLKIHEEARDWVESEQRRLKKADRLPKKPTQAELFDRMLATYSKAVPGGSSESGTPKLQRKPDLVSKHPAAHGLLEFILENGTAQDGEWITGNLKNFAEAIRSRARQPSRKANGG